MSESIQELRAQIARKAHLDTLLADLYQQRGELEKRMLTLKVAKREEQKDVDRLQGRSLAAFFYAVVGKKEEKLDKERAEAYAASVKYDAAAHELVAVEEDIRRYKAEVTTLRYAETRCAKALEEKAEALKASGTPQGEELLRLEEHIALLESRKTEIEEALSAGRAARNQADAVLTQLEDAHGLGTWDLLGGGLLTDMAKYSSLDNAQQKIEDLQVQLRRFRTELADVTIHAEMQVEIDEFLRFADYFFDGLFADWTVLDRIEQAAAQVRNTRAQVENVIETLKTRLAEAEKELASEKEKRSAQIEQADI